MTPGDAVQLVLTAFLMGGTLTALALVAKGPRA